ncbi:MAG TPA: oxidoreductase [Pseudonocardiaceae bacterium]
MGLFSRLRRRRPGAGPRPSSDADTEHLRAWASTRRGVEAFVEPRTTVTETTVVLVAHDGEWTRRRVAGPEAARKFARKLRMPIYDVALVGYPRRMREYDARQRILRDRERRRDL